TSPDDQARAVGRLDAADAVDEVRAEGFEGAPVKSVGTVGGDEFRRGVEAVGQRTARGLGPETGPDVVGVPTEEEIEGLAMRGEDHLSCGGIAIGAGPSAVGVIAVFVGAAGSLDHAVQRNMFDDFELPHFELPFKSLAFKMSTNGPTPFRPIV